MIFFLLRFFKIFFLIVYSYIPSKKYSFAKKLTVTLPKMGPTFVKLAQTLSTRPDIIGVEIADELALLCDSMPSFEFSQVKSVIEKEFNASIDAIYRSIEETPVAAASVAQVHKAITLRGEKVAIKVLRPGIEKRFAYDINLLLFCARIAQYFVSSRLQLLTVIRRFRDNVKFELDMRIEAANCSELQNNMRGEPGFFVPDVYWDLTTSRVLTLSWVEGRKIRDVKDAEGLAKRLAITFFQQVYRDGFFHGDMHPGNLIIVDSGDIAVVDFGLMSRLDRDTRIYILEILRGFINRDYEHVANIHFLAGYASVYNKHFVTACRALGESFVGKPASETSVGKLLSYLFKITRDFDMQVQPQLLLLEKNIILLEGNCKRLYEDINIWDVVSPYLEKWGRDNLSILHYGWNYLKLSIIKEAPEFIRQYHMVMGCSYKKTGKKQFLIMQGFMVVVWVFIGYAISSVI